jgi:hypothetical protein
VTGCGCLLLDLVGRTVRAGSRTLAEGEPVTLDANTGLIFAGEAELVVEYPTSWLDEIRKWRLASPSGEKLER